jgi:Zn ribbon nucleic-acid-binding protein
MDRIEEKFDITDSRNQYAACPVCHSLFDMGLVTNTGSIAVQCLSCGFRGPGFPSDCKAETDKKVFDAWNDYASAACTKRALEIAHVIIFRAYEQNWRGLCGSATTTLREGMAAVKKELGE